MGKLGTEKSTAEAYVQEILYEPADEILFDRKVINKHNYLDNEPTKVHDCIEDVMHPNIDTCDMVNNEVKNFKRTGCDKMLAHNCVAYERNIYSS